MRAAPGECRTTPILSHPSVSWGRSACANQAACSRPISPYWSSGRWLYAMDEFRPATTVCSFGTGNRLHGWSLSKTRSSPWYSSRNSPAKCRHLGQYGGRGGISSASQVLK